MSASVPATPVSSLLSTCVAAVVALLTSPCLTFAHADDSTYRVFPSQYQEVLKSHGAPVLDHIILAVRPDPAYFPWIEGGTAQSKGLNFEVGLSSIKKIPKCSDAEGHLGGIHGVVGPRYFDNQDSQSATRFAYVISHSSTAFEHDEDVIATLDGVSAAEFNKTDSLFALPVGRNGSASLELYRSPSAATVLGLCVRDNLGPGNRCHAVINTDTAGFYISLDSSMFDTTSRLECVVGVVEELQRATNMHEIPMTGDEPAPSPTVE